MTSLDRQRNQIREWTETLVSFPTYRRPGSDDLEFERALSNALEWITEWAETRGIESYNWADRVLELEIGDGRPVTGIVAHLDVVPPGDEPWDTDDPFYVTETQVDGETVLVGRGVTDDKGPVAALLVVLDQLKDTEDHLDGTIRLILDTAEEIGFDNMRSYFENHEDRKPDATMVMDGYFPMVAGEKGVAWLDVEVEWETPNQSGADLELVSVDGGDAYNQVLGSATAEILVKSPSDPIDETLMNLPGPIRKRLSLHRQGRKCFFRAEGTATHGSTPQEGDNALEPLILCLLELDELQFPVDPLLSEMIDGRGHYRWRGEWLGIESKDQRFESGTTANLGYLSMDSNHLSAGLDIRFMPGQDADTIRKSVRGRIEHKVSRDENISVEVTPVQSEPALLVDTDDPLPELALEAYRDVTGNHGDEPVYMGGRTDATVIPNSFAFGLMRNERAPFYNFHGVNERVYLDELVDAAKIYCRTLIERHRGD